MEVREEAERPRTPLADFFSILLSCAGRTESRWTKLASQKLEDSVNRDPGSHHGGEGAVKTDHISLGDSLAHALE